MYVCMYVCTNVCMYKRCMYVQTYLKDLSFPLLYTYIPTYTHTYLPTVSSAAQVEVGVGRNDDAMVDLEAEIQGCRIKAVSLKKEVGR